MSGPFSIAIGMGGNLGDPREAFRQALRWLACLEIAPIRLSRLYWTRPWGVAGQPDFLNAAVAAETRLLPLEALRRCLAIENQLGRQRSLRWGPRTLDLDLLLYEDLQMETAELHLPHPRIGERDFVLAPLIDLEAPPPSSLAPQGWQVLLDRIPAAGRTILRSEPWSLAQP